MIRRERGEVVALRSSLLEGGNTFPNMSDVCVFCFATVLGSEDRLMSSLSHVGIREGIYIGK
jgi:hypothetical protein